MPVEYFAALRGTTIGSGKEEEVDRRKVVLSRAHNDFTDEGALKGKIAQFRGCPLKSSKI